MRQQMESLVTWKDQNSANYEHNKKMFEQARTLVLNLKAENKKLCSLVQEREAEIKMLQAQTQPLEGAHEKENLEEVEKLKDTVLEQQATIARLTRERQKAIVENAKLNDALWRMEGRQNNTEAQAHGFEVVQSLPFIGQAEVQDPAVSPASHMDDDQSLLKAQIMSLVQEVKDLEENKKKLQFDVKVSMAREKEAEEKLMLCREEMGNLRHHDEGVIDQLRLKITDLDAALDAERRVNQAEHRKLAETRAQYENLLRDFTGQGELLEALQGAVTGGSNVVADSARMRQQAEEIDSLTARLLSMEDVIRCKESETKQTQMKLHKVQEELEIIPVLKAQADLYQTDFNAERQARERKHQENDRLMDDIRQLQLQNQQLQDEIAAFSQNHLQDIRRSNTSPRGRNSSGGSGAGSSTFVPRGVHYNYQTSYDEADSDLFTIVSPGNQQVAAGSQNHDSAFLQCPRCHWQFTTATELEQHMRECVAT